MIATAYGPEQWALAGATALAAIGGFVTLIFNLLQSRRNATKIEAVHDVVNGAADKQAARVEQLGDALKDAGVNIPPRPASAQADE